MEQFSLEKYLANPSRKVVTRDGKNVRILCTDRKLDFKEVVGLTMNNDEHQRKFIAKTYAIYREILHKIVNNGVYKRPTLTCEEGGELPIIKEVED